MLKSKRDGTWGKGGEGDEADADVDPAQDHNAQNIPNDNPPILSSPKGSSTTSKAEPLEMHTSESPKTCSRKRSSGGIGPLEQLFEKQRTGVNQIEKFLVAASLVIVCRG